MKSLKVLFLIASIVVSAQVISMEQPPQGPEKPKMEWPTGESIQRSIWSDRYPRAATIGVLGSYLALKGADKWSPNLDRRTAALLQQGSRAAFGGVFAGYLMSPYLYQRGGVLDEIREDLIANKQFQKEIDKIVKERENKQ